MKDKYVLTAESVTEGHPDKLCDTIADAVVDACLEHDPTAHVACEVMATAGKIIALARSRRHGSQTSLPLSAAPCGKPDMAAAIMRWR